MPLVCPSCGQYTLDNEDRRADKLSCEGCGSSVRANLYSLFIITGASGSGKTSVLPLVRSRLPNSIVYDADLLWGRCAEGQFLNNWLKIAYSNAQAGVHTILCGTVMPWDLDAAENRPLVGSVFYLNLHCENTDRASRLFARPSFRGMTVDFV